MIEHADCKLGDIVYYVDYIKDSNEDKPHVKFGTVKDMYSDGLYLDLYVVKDMRTVMCEYDNWKPILITEFEPDHRWHKLPKGWTYNTQLYKYGTADGGNDIAWDVYNANLTDPFAIKSLIDKGYLVKLENQTRWVLDDNITKDGYQIVKKVSDTNHYNPTHELVSWHKAYTNYGGAEDELNAYITELKRVATLSDEDWSKEKIENTLIRYKKFGNVNDDIINKIRDFLFKQKNIEDIETRITHEGLQYKYWKNKKWITLTGGAI